MAKIRIPGPLRKLTNDAEIVTADAASLAEAIDLLDGEYPGIKDRICDEAGQIRRFVNFYVIGEEVRFLDNLATKLNGTDVQHRPRRRRRVQRASSWHVNSVRFAANAACCAHRAGVARTWGAQRGQRCRDVASAASAH
jgi:molybdopterin synthase sulfur carrier subunit